MAVAVDDFNLLYVFLFQYTDARALYTSSHHLFNRLGILVQAMGGMGIGEFELCLQSRFNLQLL